MKMERVYHLYDVYDVSPSFCRFLEKTFDADSISKEWKGEIANISKDKRVLEIGAGCGRVTKLIARSGARVTAVEPNKRFLRILRKGIPPRARSRVRIIGAAFPEIKREAYDVIILHQNVFLELANAMGIAKAIRTLRRFLSDDGTILFDYVWPFRPHIGRATDMYKGMVRGIGRVQYSYFLHSSAPNGRYAAEMRFSVTRKGRLICDERFVLRFSLPSFVEVEKAFKKSDASVRFKPMKGFSFFPGRLILARAAFQGVR